MLVLRPARMEDARRLFEWRNDPLTRANSRCSEPVAWTDHLRWLERTIANRAHRLMIVEVDGMPAATARFDYGDQIELSMTIAPKFRGRGYSLEIASLVMAQEPEFDGYIKRSNVICQRLMRRAGMLLVEDGELQHWRYVKCLESASPPSCESLTC